MHSLEAHDSEEQTNEDGGTGVLEKNEELHKGYWKKRSLLERTRTLTRTHMHADAYTHALASPVGTIMSECGLECKTRGGHGTQVSVRAAPFKPLQATMPIANWTVMCNVERKREHRQTHAHTDTHSFRGPELQALKLAPPPRVQSPSL